DPMRRYRDKNKEIAGRGAAHPDLALPGEPDADAVLDPRRDVDRQRLFTTGAALTTASSARIVDDPSGTLTPGAGLLQGEKALPSKRSAQMCAAVVASINWPVMELRAMTKSHGSRV